MQRRVKLALAGAAGSVGLLFLCWLLAFHVGFIARADLSILNGFIGLGHGRERRVAYSIARLCSPDPYVYLAAVPVVVALLRRRPLVALAVLAVLIGANATTELLKPLMAAARAGVGATSVGAVSASAPGSTQSRSSRRRLW